MADNTDSTNTETEKKREEKKGTPLSRPGITVLGTYLVVFMLVTVGAIWRLIPSCDAVGLIATRLVPALALTSGGEQLRITGEGFQPGATVRIGNAPPINAALISPFEITVIAPKQGAGRVAVAVAQGRFPTVDIPGGLEYVDTRPPAPVVTTAPPPPGATGATAPAPLQIGAIEPTIAVVGGGDAIGISGLGFTPDTVVRFGGVPARSVRVDSPRFITAVTPMHQQGTVSVTVADSQSSSTLDGRLRYVCPGPPDDTLVLLVLLAGALGGLVHAMRSFYWYSGEQALVRNWVPMYVMLPFASSALGFVFYLVIRSGIYQPTEGSSYLLVGLAALVGMFSAQASEKLKKLAEGLFTDVKPGSNAAPPGSSTTAATSAFKIAPSFGPVGGGNRVTITGSGFTLGTLVRFGSTTVPQTQVACVNETILEVVVPKGASGTVDVGVTVPGKDEVVQTSAYTYTAAKGQITKIDPPSGRIAGGEQVTLTGKNFSNGVSVMFRNKEATVVSVSQTTIVVSTPSQENPGDVEVRVDKGSELIGISSGGFIYTP